MSLASITSERLSLALDQIKSTDGTLWESFANSFLASEFPDLRPVGGMHDSGRDAFLFESDGEPGIYLQYSLQQTFETKISETLAVLQKNGFVLQQLIYCSPLDIIKKADGIKRVLRRQGVSLDIRDRGYFVSFRNQSAARISASEELAKKLVDPLLSNVNTIAKIPHALTDKEERTALAYFQISVSDRASDKSVSKLCYETLVRYALREATPENPFSLQKIVQTISPLVPGESSRLLADKVTGSVSRLVSRGILKHQTHPATTDGYALSHPERTVLQQHIQKLIGEVANLIAETSDIASRIAELNEIDYVFDPSSVAKDALMLCDYFLMDMGLGAAKAFESKEFFNPAKTTLTEFASRLTCYGTPLASFAALGLPRFLDLVPQTAEVILKKPSKAAEQYLERVADSYYLLFVLRQPPEVMQAVGKVVGTSKILLDASVLVPCMAEILLPSEERRFTNLFRAAVESGVKLYVSQEAIAELAAVIRKARAIYASDQAQGFHYGNSGLLEAFHANPSGWKGGFLEFLEEFASENTADEDLKIFLKHHLAIEFSDFEKERTKIDQGLLESFSKKLKPTRKFKDITEIAEDRLARNDVTCLLLIGQLRNEEDATSSYGFSWWWLTSDHAVYALDRHLYSPNTCICMSPNFLLRYLSIQPLSSKVDIGVARHLPLAVDVAAVGLIPHQIKKEVESLLTTAEKMPRYMRIRKIRDLMNLEKSQQENPI